MTTHILGISAYYHDSAAALVSEGTITAAAQEERFTRKKHDASFPKHAIEYCLEEAEIDLSEVKYIVFYDKPLIKFERILETYLAYAPTTGSCVSLEEESGTGAELSSQRAHQRDGASHRDRAAKKRLRRKIRHEHLLQRAPLTGGVTT